MIKKIAILALSTLLLGGCTLLDTFKISDAAKDEKPGSPIATTTPAPTSSPDTNLEAMPSTSDATDLTSLETDINSTLILEEDFSDLE